MQSGPKTAGSNETIAILAGNGTLPVEVADDLIGSGRLVYVLGIEGEAESVIERFDHDYIRWGQVSKLFKLLKAAGVCDYYSDIRHFIKDGLVNVNGEANKLKHTMIKIGDLVEYKEYKINIIESRPKGEQREERAKISQEFQPQAQRVQHGKLKSWRPKPIELENEMANELQTVTQKLHEKLLFKKLKLSLAESCTGGMIQEMITSYSGASEYFEGGVVTG